MELWHKLTGKYGYPKVCITIFLVFLIILAVFQKQDIPAMAGDSLVRIAMNAILVLAMVPSIVAGAGINFGLSLGIITGLLAGCISIEMDMRGLSAFMWAVAISIPLSAAMGYWYGWILNKVKGDEMTVGTYMGFAIVSLMSIGWLLMPFKSPEMIWAIGGSGLRTTISLSGRYAKVLDDLLAIPFFGSQIPTGAILFVAIFCLIIWLFMRSKTGIAMMAAGDNPKFAIATGIDVDRQRMIGTVMSTVLGGIGMLVYSQSFGFLQLYQAPLMMPFAATAAILIGGATDKKATIAHVVAGTILFQTLLTISLPVINSAVNVGNLSEVIRIIVSNGVILYALTKVGGNH
ncbi:ABC transporter permease subunit [Sporomusa sp.]|uniref:ABC transporter permease subunit n=1 Tax=Sporomusa sp. TaxID=2078658 RepID=UPI002C5EA5A2|nr:ABC transporter permease [Sporomusa sp.]HWR09483.1 ABC transporter permease [Sporomusa sp.]